MSDNPEASTLINNNEKLPPVARLKREPLSLKRSISPGFSFRRRSNKRSSVRSFKSAKLSTTAATLLDTAQTVTLTNYKCPSSSTSMTKLKKASNEDRRVSLKKKCFCVSQAIVYLLMVERCR